MIPFRLILITLGIAIIVVDFIAYSVKKMGESYGLLWMFLGAFTLVVGIIKKDWSAFSAIDNKLMIPAMIIIFIALLLIFRMSSTLSVLIRQNQELAMHVSLLNQENELLVKKLIGEEEIRDMSLLKNAVKENSVEA
jgi:hypothetical protein